jgi:hypothetical protein
METAEGTDFLKEMVLQEASGKNEAIHSYDDIIWKIRSGYLALFFAGWSSLVKSFATDQQIHSDLFKAVVAAMFYFSAILAYTGWYLDRTYVRRKHKVINALDELAKKSKELHGDAERIPLRVLTVAGDNPSMRYDSPGYLDAARTARIIYFVPLAALAAALVGFFLAFR